MMFECLIIKFAHTRISTWSATELPTTTAHIVKGRKRKERNKTFIQFIVGTHEMNINTLDDAPKITVMLITWENEINENCHVT